MKNLPNKLDVVIVGAGISGINTAYRLQTELPDQTYSILEARDSIGGTWDLFRFPGIRSDTDMHCFAFPWRPWKEDRLLIDGATILEYLKEAVAAEKIDRNIRFGHKLLSASWLTEDQIWDLTVGVGKEKIHIMARAIVIGCGYYDYHNPLAANIPGLENFQGKVVHPQFWPENLDYTGKKIVVVGSGATAVTLLPSLTDKAEHVTMLQRSPTYIMPLANHGTTWLIRILPRSLALKIVRLQLMIIPILMYTYCRLFPQSARKMLRREALTRLGDESLVDQHFKPSYDPWDQRLCFAPDGDFFNAIRCGKASVATDHIDKIGPNSIILTCGQSIPADIIVTATGLRLSIAGGATFFVDDKPVALADKILWRNSWLQDMPNCAFVLGYTNASWTLGADTTAVLFCRILKALRSGGLSSAVPRIPASVAHSSTTAAPTIATTCSSPSSSVPMKTRPYFNIKSTYARQGANWLPKTADVGPWKGRTNYILDSFRGTYGSINDGMEYYKGSSPVKRGG